MTTMIDLADKAVKRVATSMLSVFRKGEENRKMKRIEIKDTKICLNGNSRNEECST